MRKFLLIALCGLVLSACEKEFSEETGTIPGTNPPPTTPGTNPPANPGTSNGLCFTCDYLPICDNSRFEYIDTMMTTVTPVTTIFNLLGDTTMNGATWKKLKDASSGMRVYSNCDNSVVKLFTVTATSTGGNTVNNITQTPVKGNEALGATWKDMLLNQLGQTVEYRYTLVAKNLTRQVYDSTYNNIIYVRDTTVLLMPGLGEFPSNVRHSYFAKGIGMVEQRTEELNMGLTIMVRKLKKYTL